MFFLRHSVHCFCLVKKLNNCETIGSASKAVRQLKMSCNKRPSTTEKLTEYIKYYQNSLTVHV